MTAAASLGSFIVNLGRLAKIPCGEARVFRIGGQPIAVFHTDAHVFATEPTCPRKGCTLVDGRIGEQKVTCPLHSLAFDLTDGHAVGNGCRALKTYPAMVNEDGDIVVGIEQLLAARRNARQD